MSDLESRFNAALNYIKNTPSDIEISNKQKLSFYGLFKQVSTGPCKISGPSRLKMVERAKWDAWKSLGNMGKEEAMKKYIEELTSSSPKWEQPTPKL